MPPDPAGPPAPPRWAHLAAAAFRLDEVPSPRLEDVRAALDDVLEVFDARLDPVEAFEATAVRRFALSLRRAVGGAS